jgi:vancomycin resistance protein YoaR
MQRRHIGAGLAIAAAFAAACLVVLAGPSDAASDSPSTVRAGTRIAGVAVGGLPVPEAEAAVVDELASRRATPIAVRVDGETLLRISAGDAGLAFDPDDALDRAVALSALPEIFPYRERAAEPPRAVAADRRYDVEWSVDEMVVAELADRLQRISARAVREGRLDVVDGAVTAMPPEPGSVLADPSPRIAAAVAAAAVGGGPQEIELTTDSVEPDVSMEELEAEAARLDAALEGDVTLLVGGSQPLNLPEAAIRRAASVIWDRETGWDLRLTSDALEDWVKAHRNDVRIPSVDARLEIDDPWVRVIPSVPAQVPDTEGLASRVQRAISSVTRATAVPYTDGPEAFFSTEDAHALGIREKIGTFTTYHACCENRVVNIHLIADAADEAMVMPGETWSLNAHVGERTREKGYLPAGAIIGGVLECCDHPVNIGGGTSQFATTIYNAIFFAGLEIVEHQPHTIYFSRYPEGREATMGWPKPDVVFRNNTENAVLIDTSYTGTSITVSIYGDNGGLNVRSDLSDRFRYTGPIATYERNPQLEPGTQVVVKPGSGGWSVIVTRTITDARGELVSEEEWTWAYLGAFRVIEYN